MLIEKVELKNIKLYKERIFNFCQGINVLSGPNGSGKSTVFEAIGYALFHVDAQDFIGNERRLIRKGEKNGSVVVHFAVEDGNRYVIERRVGSKSWRLFRKLEDGKRLAVEVKNDAELEGMLKGLLGLKGDQPLKKQFLDIIGPLQSDFLGPFIKPGTSRQVEFDKILGISAWREVFDHSIELKREAERQVEKREEAIARKTAEVATYDRVVEELGVQQQRLAQTRDAQARAGAELAGVTQRVADMDRAKADIERLQKEQMALDEKGTALRMRHADAEVLWRRAQQAADRCRALEPGYRACVEAEHALDPLREQEKNAAQLRQDLLALEKEMAVLQNSIDTRRQSLREKHERAVALRDGADQQMAELRLQLAAAQQQVRQTSETAEAFEMFQLQGRDLCARPKAIREEAVRWIKDAIPIADRLAAQEQRLRRKAELLTLVPQEGELEKNYQSALERLSELEARKKQLKEGNAKLAGGVCPFFEESCLNLEKQGSAPENFFGGRIEDLDREAAKATEQKRALQDRLKTVRQAQRDLSQLIEVETQCAHDRNRLAHFREHLAKLLQPVTSGAFLIDLSDWLRQAPEGLPPKELVGLLDLRTPSMDTTGEWTAQAQWVVNACAPLEAMVARLQDVLTQQKRALDQQQREAGESLARTEEQMKALEKTKAEAERDIQGLETEKVQWLKDRDALNRQKAVLAERAAAAQAYDGLAERIQALETVRREHSEAYQQYLGHRPAADELTQRQEDLAKLQDQIAGVAETAARLQAELGERASAYQPAAHEAARQAQKHLIGQTEGLKVEIKGLEADVERLENEKARMDAIRKEIKTLAAEAKQYQKTLRFVENMREKVFRKVSEQLSERFREEISQLADRIYRVIARSDEELHWGNNYAIELVDLQNGEERRRYDEELSGGQVMSAVVALRLALLRTYGAKIGFFDEPTSNLDELRRANLALAFRSLDEGKGEVGSPWYNQLFLISHDVAFTEITDQIIHLGNEP